MTLIAAFRCRNNGILLCADRKEDDGFAIRPFEKIYTISELPSCQIFIAGSGTTSSIADARAEIHKTLGTASQEQTNIYAKHTSLIESSLKTIHTRHKDDLKQWPLRLIVVVAPRAIGSVPLLYWSDRTNLIPESLYISHGAGKTISDYFATRLYKQELTNFSLITLAAFILREAEQSASGVGLGNDMILIYPGGSRGELHTESVAEIQKEIPSLADTIQSHWSEHVKLPDWLRHYADSAESAE